MESRNWDLESAARAGARGGGRCDTEQSIIPFSLLKLRVLSSSLPLPIPVYLPFFFLPSSFPLFLLFFSFPLCSPLYSFPLFLLYLLSFSHSPVLLSRAYILSPCPFPSTSVHTNSGQTTGELPVHFETQCLQCRRDQINEGDKQVKAETASKREQGLLLPTCHPIRSWRWRGVWAWCWPSFPRASV